MFEGKELIIMKKLLLEIKSKMAVTVEFNGSESFTRKICLFPTVVVKLLSMVLAAIRVSDFSLEWSASSY